MVGRHTSQASQEIGEKPRRRTRSTREVQSDPSEGNGWLMPHRASFAKQRTEEKIKNEEEQSKDSAARGTSQSETGPIVGHATAARQNEVAPDTVVLMSGALSSLRAIKQLLKGAGVLHSPSCNRFLGLAGEGRRQRGTTYQG
jgi:hypothetical protein